MICTAPSVSGDSVTKQWRAVEPQVNGTPQVFTQYFGNYSAAILGVGGEYACILYLVTLQSCVPVLTSITCMHMTWHCAFGAPGCTTLHAPEALCH